MTRAKPDIMSIDGTDNTVLGSDIDGDGFPNFFGTSAATPHAAAVAALMLQAKPSLTPAQLYAQMKATATPVSASPNVAGVGLVDAYRSVYNAPVPATLPASRRLRDRRSDAALVDLQDRRRRCGGHHRQ